MVAATLNATGASALFTQDLDDNQPDYAPTPAVDGDAAMDAIAAPPPAKKVIVSAVPTASGDLCDVIVAVTQKGTAAKPYWFVDTKSGTSLVTFDKEAAGVAGEWMTAGQEVTMTWQDKSGKGKQLGTSG